MCPVGNALYALSSILIPYSISSQSAASSNYLTWKRLMNISCKEVSKFYCHGGRENLKILPLDLAFDCRLLTASLSTYTTKSTMKNTNYFSTGRRIETDRLLKEQY